MSDVAILTAVYDGYDALKPVLAQRGVDVDWVFVTDDPELGAQEALLGWRVVYEPRPGVHPNRAAKYPKYWPWRYTAAPASLWVDASFRIVSETFAADALGQLTDEAPIAQFAHPWRDCIYAEAEASAPLAKYDGEPVLKQAEHYRAAGHPEGWGLWATGIIGRRHTSTVRELGDLWGAETDRWSFQDQISEPYALRQTGLRPTGFPGNHLATPWLVYEGSGRH